MKVLFITNNFPPITDGVGDYTFHLCNEFSKNGHEVYVICSDKKEIIFSASQQGPQIKVLPIIKDWTIASINRLVPKIISLNPDFILLQYVPHSFNRYGIPFSVCWLVLKLRLSKLNVIITFHEIAIRLDWKQPKYIPVAVNQRIIAFFLSCISRNNITSIQLYQKMLSYSNKKIYRIPIGSNILDYSIEEKQIMALRRKLKPADEFLICTFGANARKSDLLLQVVAALGTKYNIKLMFIGKLPEWWIQKIQTEAENLKVSDKLLITGYLSSEEVFLHLKCADAFLQLEDLMYNKWGGVSTKSTALAAAYLAGLPIIGTRGDMTDDFFSDGENIMLCKNNSLPEITEKIVSLIESKDLQEQLRNKSIEVFRNHLRWELIYKKYHQIITT